jgi:hypothetical protein
MNSLKYSFVVSSPLKSLTHIYVFKHVKKEHLAISKLENKICKINITAEEL